MPADERNAKDTDANTLILGGLGIGAFGVISAAIGGAVCPVCVVAAPALLGIGAYKRWMAAKRPPSESFRVEVAPTTAAPDVPPEDHR